MLYLPRRDRSGYRNVVKEDNINWGKKQVRQLAYVIYKHEKHLRENKSLNIRVIKNRDNSKKRRLLTQAEILRKTGFMVGTVEKIRKSDYLKGIKMPRECALLLDHLLVSVEENQKLRLSRLKRIFAGKPKVEDQLWINVIWDHTKADIPRRYSHKRVSKYFKNGKVH